MKSSMLLSSYIQYKYGAVMHAPKPTCVLYDLRYIPEYCCTVTRTVFDELSTNPDLWIGDSGATTHITFSKSAMADLTAPKDATKVIVGNGEVLEREQIGNLHGTIYDKDENYLYNATLKNVVVSSNAQFNLLSITVLLLQGWELHGSKSNFTLTHKHHVLNFDRLIHTERGILFVIKLARKTTIVGIPGFEWRRATRITISFYRSWLLQCHRPN